MINDRRQKQAALNYVLGKRWFPQLELVIQPARSASSRIYEITDIDVYGAAPDEFSAYRSILFDCKSSRRESPVTRALWLSGLMNLLNASRGICVLSDQREISLDHRESAAELDVSLMTMSEFDVFARATDGYLPTGLSNLSDIERWDGFFSIGRTQAALQPAVEFSTRQYWALNAPGDSVRHSIALLRTLRGELDPRKKEHQVIFGDILALFLFAIARVGHRLFGAFLQPDSRQALDAVLLPYIYGGRETYQLIKDLTSVIPRRTEDSSVREPNFPEWDMFVNLVRSLLDSPMQALGAPLLAREIAWSRFDDHANLAYAEFLARKDRQTGKFCIQAARYLVAASRIPPEFGDIYQQVFLAVQAPPSRLQSPRPSLPIDQ